MPQISFIQFSYLISFFLTGYIFLKIVFNNNSELSKKLLTTSISTLILTFLLVVKLTSSTIYEQKVLLDCIITFFFISSFTATTLIYYYNNVQLNIFFKQTMASINFLICILAITNKAHELLYSYTSVSSGLITRVDIVSTVYFELALWYILGISVANQVIMYRNVENKLNPRFISFFVIMLITNISYLISLASFHVNSQKVSYLALTVIFEIIALFLISLRYELNSKVSIIKHYVVENFNTPIIVLRKDKRIVKYNKSAGEVFKSLNDIHTESIDDVTEIMLHDHKDFDILNTSIINVYMREATSMSFKVSVSDVKASEISRYNLIVLDDVTTIRDIEQDFVKLTTVDQLTGLFNRQHFKFIGEGLLRDTNSTKNTLALFMLDIDFFKSVNDNFGHLIGDEFLISTAKIIQNVIKDYGYVGRYGGEEFCGILNVLNEEEAFEILTRLRKTIEQNYVKVSNINTHNITVSIGFALTDLSKDLDTLFRYADVALYKAKNTGRNNVIWYTQD